MITQRKYEKAKAIIFAYNEQLKRQREDALKVINTMESLRTIVPETRIDDTTASVRLLNGLRSVFSECNWYEITIEKIAKRPMNDFRFQRGMGSKSLNELVEILQMAGLKFKQ